MKKIGIFYGPAGGSSTEKVAYKVAEQIGENKVDLIPVKDATFKDLSKYSNLIFRISTVGYVDTNEYDFDESQGIYKGKFIGLPIDEDFEAHLTDERIRKWLDKILPQFV